MPLPRTVLVALSVAALNVKRPGHLRLATVLALASSLIFIAVAPVLGAGSWTSPVEVGATFGLSDDWDFTLDSRGKAHVAYAHVASSWPPDDGIVYATNKSGEWTRVHVTTGEHQEVRSIAVNDAGKVFIAFNRNHVNWYVSNASGAWTTKRLTPGAGSPDVVLRVVGSKLHVAHWLPSGYHYRTNQSGSWVTRRVSALQRTNLGHRALDLRMDADRKAHIVLDAHPYSAKPGIHYLTNRSGSWNSRHLGAGDIPRLALGGRKAHVAWTKCYRSNSCWKSTVHYATNRSGAWTAKTVLPARPLWSGFVSIAVSEDLVPNLVFT